VVLAALTCALAPAYTVRWHLGFYPTQLLEVALLATVAVYLFETVRQGQRIDLRSPYTIPAALLLLAGALSVLVALDRRSALGLYRAYFVEPVAFFFVLAATVSTLRRATLLLSGLWVAGLVVAVPNAVVVIQAIAQHSLNLATTPPVAIYQTANAVALFLVPLIAVAASLLLYGRERWERLLSAAFLVVAVTATLLSFSRGGYLALAAVVLVLAATHRRARWLVPAAIAGALLLALLPPIRHRIEYELHSVQGNTLDWRLHLWTQTPKLMRHHPILGIGLSNYDRAMGPYWLDLSRVIYPHNIVLNFWTVTGLLGLVAFAWIMVVVLRDSWRGFRAGDAFAAIHLGVFAAMLAVIVHGLVDVPYFKNDLSLEFWALVGLTWAGLLRMRGATRARRQIPLHRDGTGRA
jgi:O-antigen ligase